MDTHNGYLILGSEIHKITHGTEGFLLSWKTEKKKVHRKEIILSKTQSDEIMITFI